MDNYKHMKNPLISFEKSLERKRKRQGKPTVLKIVKKNITINFK